jgi:hypothetical protein
MTDVSCTVEKPFNTRTSGRNRKHRVQVEKALEIHAHVLSNTAVVEREYLLLEVSRSSKYSILVTRTFSEVLIHLVMLCPIVEDRVINWFK